MTFLNLIFFQNRNNVRKKGKTESRPNKKERGWQMKRKEGKQGDTKGQKYNL